MLAERAKTDDRVVTPVIALVMLPEAEPGEKHRTVRACGELQEPTKQRLSIDGKRRRLHDSDIGTAFHQEREIDEGIAGHHAVRIEHDHEIVVVAMLAAEVED